MRMALCNVPLACSIPGAKTVTSESAPAGRARGKPTWEDRDKGLGHTIQSIDLWNLKTLIVNMIGAKIAIASICGQSTLKPTPFK